MRNDWEKSPNGKKEEAFHASDEAKKTRSKVSKKPDKPFLDATDRKAKPSWSMILEEPTQSQPTQLVQPENSVASENELVTPAGR
jgi:hypothetical protein